MAFDYSRFSIPKPGSPIAVAEIGTAHGGDLQRGLDLVDACADSGADVAKVQVVFAEEILPPEAGLVPLPGGDTPLFDVFRKLERPVEFYAALAERAENRGLGFLASPFGMRSISLLEEIGVKAWKVASPELNHEPLLERLAATGLPMILSTGVSRTSDIRRALEVVTAAADSCRIPAVTILHCITSYPAPEDQANIRAIPALASEFGYPIGLSDHSLDPILLPSLACAAGAVMVEKHITLSRTDSGLDDPVALIPGDFSRMTSAMKQFTSGNPKADLPRAVAELAGEYGYERTEACLDDGMKHLAPAEEASYGRTNRSLHAVGALQAGTILTEKNTAILRTEKVLRPGLPPRRRLEAYGRRLVRDITPGNGITEEDFE